MRKFPTNFAWRNIDRGDCTTLTSRKKCPWYANEKHGTRPQNFIFPRHKMKRICMRFVIIYVALGAGHIQTVNSFIVSQNDRLPRHGFVTLSGRSGNDRCKILTTQHESSKREAQDRELYGDCNGDSEEINFSDSDNNSSSINNNYIDQNLEGRVEISDYWRQGENSENLIQNFPTTESQNPDRAISIVSELKANAALFAAFAYGSLNLPNTLTVSESKVTSVTTSLSISRPLPDSDLIRTFVVLDVCTLCLMISCVAASQLLIYRLTDGSYEEVANSNRGVYDPSRRQFDSLNGQRKRKNSRVSALGRLVTTYRNEFTVARITFDLGLVTLLFSVGVRSLAIFDEDIVVPVAIVIGVTAIFLAVAYVTTYYEVFRTAENLASGPLFPTPFPFLSKAGNTDTDSDGESNDLDDDARNPIISQFFLPISVISVGLGLYFTLLSSGSVSSESNLSRLGPYDVTSGATKLRVVTEKIDSEKGKKQQQKVRSNTSKKARAKAALEKSEAEAAKKKAIEAEAAKKAEEDAKKKIEEETKRKAEEEAKKKAEDEAKKKAEEEARKREEELMKKLEKEARRRAEEEANAASAAAKAKVEAAMEAAKKKAQEETTSTASGVA